MAFFVPKVHWPKEQNTCAMRRLKKRDEADKTHVPDIGGEPDISPEVSAERAEGRIFEESLRKDKIASGYRTKIGGKK